MAEARKRRKRKAAATSKTLHRCGGAGGKKCPSRAVIRAKRDPRFSDLDEVFDTRAEWAASGRGWMVPDNAHVYDGVATWRCPGCARLLEERARSAELLGVLTGDFTEINAQRARLNDLMERTKTKIAEREAPADG